ncbi:VOC family protein [Mycobacterium sp. 1164966.3]|uniref:VOC family protein n=1 Tax=Mycobacterium sp. 1164966.3 TaxID=1856861 RepID=UPI0012E80F5D
MHFGIVGGTIWLVDNAHDRPRLAGLHHLGISVTNLDRSLRFYCDVVGANLLVPPNRGHQFRVHRTDGHSQPGRTHSRPMRALGQ